MHFAVRGWRRRASVEGWFRDVTNDRQRAPYRGPRTPRPRGAPRPLAAVEHGAVIIDIRSETQRQTDGVIPGALFYERNVLEWRIDPASGYSDPVLGGDLDRHLILVCNEGFQSSLAAGTLRDLGFSRATDLVGGFQAWKAAGLPVALRP
jgi:rhodanese-related sulfurtransferase